MATHYTAVIEIHKRVKEAAVHSNYDRDRKPEVNEVTEVARVVVRAESLDNLITKAGKHLELLMD